MSTSNKVTISGHHIEITPALEEKINHMATQLSHKCSNITNIHVTLKIDTKTTTHKQRQTAEASCHVLGKDIFAKVSSDDMYNSINKLRDKLDQQLVKHKEASKDHNEYKDKYDHHHNNALKRVKKTSKKQANINKKY